MIHTIMTGRVATPTPLSSGGLKAHTAFGPLLPYWDVDGCSEKHCSFSALFFRTIFPHYFSTLLYWCHNLVLIIQISHHTFSHSDFHFLTYYKVYPVVVNNSHVDRQICTEDVGRIYWKRITQSNHPPLVAYMERLTNTSNDEACTFDFRTPWQR
jgi:hypothetical protein